MAMQIRENFHTLIDKIEDEKTLKGYFRLIETLNNHQTGKLWNTLTTEEQQELLVAYDESFNSSNLIQHNELKTQHGKWLNK